MFTIDVPPAPGTRAVNGNTPTGERLAALIGAQKALRESTRLIVVCPANLRRIFEVTGLESLVCMVGSSGAGSTNRLFQS